MLADFEFNHFARAVEELLKSLGLEGNRYVVWVEFALIVMTMLASTGVIGFLTGRRRFKKRYFFDQMVIGVNILEIRPGGRIVLMLRTLIENNLEALLDNPVLQRMVEQAARKCSERDPILRLKNTEDHFLLLTKVQNAISSCFAKEHVLRMFGYPSKGQWADFVVTCERYGGLKATKIRVLVFVKEEMQKLTDPEFFAKVEVEQAHHKDRARTLLLIAQNCLDDENVIKGRVEIPLPIHN